MRAGVQLRFDAPPGYGLPLRPEALASLNCFEFGHICAVLRLDEEQVACAEQAVAAVLAGEYGRAGR